MHRRQQDPSQIKWISDFIWNIAVDRLRDVTERDKYRDVILPFIVLRRLDAVLEPTKQAVLKRKRFLDRLPQFSQLQGDFVSSVAECSNTKPKGQAGAGYR